MLRMPIRNKGKIFNLEVSLKGTVVPKKSSPQIIDIGGRTFDSTNMNISVLDLIRTNSRYLYDKKYYVTSKESTLSNKTVTYQLPTPQEKTDLGLENLYYIGLVDLLKNEPENKKGRIISLKDLGLFSDIGQDELTIIKQVTNNINDLEKREAMLNNFGIKNLKSRYNFLQQFNFSIVDSAIEKEKFNSVLEFFDDTNSKLSHELNKYNKALDGNTEEMRKIFIISKAVTNSTLELIESKRLVKVNKDEQRAA